MSCSSSRMCPLRAARIFLSGWSHAALLTSIASTRWTRSGAACPTPRAVRARLAHRAKPARRGSPRSASGRKFALAVVGPPPMNESESTRLRDSGRPVLEVIAQAADLEIRIADEPPGGGVGGEVRVADLALPQDRAIPVALQVGGVAGLPGGLGGLGPNRLLRLRRHGDVHMVGVETVDRELDPVDDLHLGRVFQLATGRQRPPRSRDGCNAGVRLGEEVGMACQAQASRFEHDRASGRYGCCSLGSRLD